MVIHIIKYRIRSLAFFECVSKDTPLYLYNHIRHVFLFQYHFIIKVTVSYNIIMSTPYRFLVITIVEYANVYFV